MSKDVRATYNRILLEPPDLKTANLDAPRNTSRVASGNAILILDDDSHFRALVSHLLEPRGYEVIEARSAEEALECLKACTPAAAIVDYRLPGMDGMTWIAKIRELGIDMPVVFVSGVWCDQRTFTWLRNILKVSLVVKKPIIPEAFLSSLELIVPPPDAKCECSAATARISQEEPVQLDALLNHHSLEEALSIIDSLLATGNISAKTREQLALSRKLLATRQSVERIRRKYAMDLPSIWSSFVASLKELREAPELLKSVLLTAHKIKGSTGSYGFMDISDVAERIEALLSSIDFSCPVEEQNVLWSEIANVCDEGVRAIDSLSTVCDAGQDCNRGKKEISLLIASPQSDVADEFARPSASFKTKVDHVVSAVGAVNRCKREVFDAAVIDLSLESQSQGYSQLALKLRNLPKCSALPLAFVLREGQKMDDASLIYSGASAVIERPVSDAEIDAVLNQLLVDSMFNKPRILCVDDDPALTAFLSSFLHKEGFSVRSLNEPIRVLEVMEEYQPHVVLLDVIMPGLSGYEVCRMIRSRHEFARTIVMILTARNDVDSRNAAFQAGADEFLGKPVVETELIARVNTNLIAKLGQDLSAPFILPESSFCNRARGLWRHCDDARTAMSLVAISFAGFADLDILFGAFSCQQVSENFAKLIGSRFRACDLRGKFGTDRFMVALPAISEDLCELVAGCLKSEWNQVWFPGSRGQIFQAEMLTAVAQFEGTQSIDLVLSRLAEQELSTGCSAA